MRDLAVRVGGVGVAPMSPLLPPFLLLGPPRTRVGLVTFSLLGFLLLSVASRRAITSVEEWGESVSG